MPAPPPVLLLDVDGVLNAVQLVVGPDLVVGLTHAELDRVEAWLG